MAPSQHTYMPCTCLCISMPLALPDCSGIHLLDQQSIIILDFVNISLLAVCLVVNTIFQVSNLICKDLCLRKNYRGLGLGCQTKGKVAVNPARGLGWQPSYLRSDNTGLSEVNVPVGVSR